MKTFLFSFVLLLPFLVFAEPHENVWKKLLKKKADCVTWVSITMRVEVSAGGRSMPPQEQKLEALGTILAEDGLTVLSLSTVDPRSKILSRIRTSGASVQVNYTEVLILMPDGSEIPAKILLKDNDLDLAFVLPLENKDEQAKGTSKKFSFIPNQATRPSTPTVLDEVVSMSKLGRNLYRQSTLRRGWVNAVIEKPRQYYVIENTTPGTPVFNKEGIWLGIVVYKMERGRPSAVVTLPAKDILEIAEQVRTRTP
ncbi:serine protease [Opitutales bacterium]|nr:serine protease [Opitutales bacterium]